MPVKNETKELGINGNKSCEGVSIPSLPVFKSKLSSPGSTNGSGIVIENDSNKENKVNFSSSSQSSLPHPLIYNVAADNSTKGQNKSDSNVNDDICSNSNATSSTLEGCDRFINADRTNTNSITNSVHGSANDISDNSVANINNHSNSSTSLTSISASLSTSSPSLSLLSKKNTRQHQQQHQRQQRLFSSPSTTFTDSPSPPGSLSISPFPPTKPSSALTSLALKETPSVIRKHRLESRVLRSGETIESFFCLTPPQSTSKLLSTDYDTIKSICHDIVHDVNSKNDIHKWKQVLDYIYKNHDIDGKNCNVNDSNLEKKFIRLYKRATSRFGTSIPDKRHHQKYSKNNHENSDVNDKNFEDNRDWDECNKNYERDLVEIWLQYAKVQYKFCNSIKSSNNGQSSSTNSIYQLLQHKNLGKTFSIYYIAMADYELHLREYCRNSDNDVKQGDGKEQGIKKARSIIEKGLKLGAKPISLLNNYMKKLEGLIVEEDSNNVRYGKSGEVCAAQEQLATEEVDSQGAGINTIGSMRASENEDVQERKVKVTAASFSVSSYRLRSKKRSPITSLSSRAKIKRSSNNLKLPRRILAIDNDDEENTDDNEKTTRSDNEDKVVTNDSNDSINDVIDSSIIKKHQKVRFLEKVPERITKDSISYLLNWDPMQRQNRKSATIEDDEKALNNENQKKSQPMQKIDESMQESTISNNGDCSNNTSSTSSGSVSLKDANNSNNSYNHTNAYAANNSTTTMRNSNSSSIQDNSVDTCVQNNVDGNKRSGKKDNPESITITHAHALNDQSINDTSQSFMTKQKSSSSSSPQGALNVDPDFLPLINKGRILSVNNLKYLKLGVIGKGGSCKVYRALASNANHSIVAIKKVKLAGMAKKSIEGYVNEISLLRRLRNNPAIIQLYDSQVDIQRKVMYLVMEAGEVDLNHVLRDQKSVNGHQSSVNMNFIRLTWQQMLGAVHCIHEERIIHGDLKPANFLFVKGALKLIDFGIAKAIQCENTTNIYRESQVGTLNYMSPESIQDSGTSKHGLRMKCGRPSDVWSLGCILYEMCYGRPPFKDIDRMIPKLQAIINPSHKINFPDTIELAAIDAMKLCLKRKPEDRAPIVGTNGLLNEHSFLHSRR